jgi:chitinase
MRDNAKDFLGRRLYRRKGTNAWVSVPEKYIQDSMSLSKDEYIYYLEIKLCNIKEIMCVAKAYQDINKIITSVLEDYWEP